MAIQTIDSNTGAPKYSAAFLLSVAALIVLVIGLTFHFKGSSPFSRRAPKIAHPYDGERSGEMASGNVPSEVDKANETQKFQSDYSRGLGDSVPAVSAPVKNAPSEPTTSSASRFDRELQVQRVNTLTSAESGADPVSGGKGDAIAAVTAAEASVSSSLQGGSEVAAVRTGSYPAIPGQFSEARGGRGTASGNYSVTPISWGSNSDAPAASASASPGGFVQGAQGTAPMGADAANYVPADVIAKRALFLSANSVPTGTHLSVRLMNNVRSNSTFKQRVWAMTTQELVFRRQVQLPRGVLLGGSVGSTSQEQVDISFDIAVFPDGTELPLSGFGVGGADPRYPDLSGMRGLRDLYIEPPLWHEFFPIILAGVTSYTNTSLQTGQGGVIVGSSGVPQTPNGTTQVNEAVNGMVLRIQSDVLAYLSRYSPYIHLRKGYPFFVELDSTVDFSARRLNAMGYEKLLQQLSQQWGGPAVAENPMKSLPEFMNTSPEKAKADVTQAMSPQALSASPLSVLAALQKALQSAPTGAIK